MKAPHHLVTHCICTRTALADLAGYPDLEAVKRETGCGAFCGLCAPYISALLAGGPKRRVAQEATLETGGFPV